MHSGDDVKAAITAIWDSAAPHYDAGWGHGLGSAAERRAWTEWLTSRIPGRQRIIDMGCGTGFLALLLADAGHQVSGVDLSQRMLAVARGAAQQLQLDIRWFTADVEDPPDVAGPADVIISRHLLWTLPNPVGAVAAWRRLLAPTGTVMVIDEFWPPLTAAARARIAIGRRWAAWKGDDDDHYGYGPAIDRELPLNHPDRPERYRDVLLQSGFGDVRIEKLSRVDRVESAQLPLRDRLQHDFQRYVISGTVMPATAHQED